MKSRIARMVLATLLGVSAPVGCHSTHGGRDGNPIPPMAMNGTGESRRQANLPPKETAAACLATAKELEKGGHSEGAIQLYEKARENDPKLSAQVSRRLAVLYDRQGEFQKANAEYEKALAASPKDAELLNNIGYSYYCRGQLTEADTYLRRALAIAPHHARAWNNLGLVLGVQEKYDESLRAFEKAVTPSQAHCNLAFLMAASGKRDMAKFHYQKALELDPGLALAKNALVKLSDPNFGKVQPAANKQPAPGPNAAAMQPANLSKPANPPAIVPTDPVIVDPR